MKAVTYGARQCITDILNYLDTEKDLETDCDKDNKICIVTEIFGDTCISFLYEILIHHDPSCGYDWTDVLTKLAALCPSLEKRNDFYRNVIELSVYTGTFDITFLFLEKIQTISEHQVFRLFTKTFQQNEIDSLNSLCKTLNNIHFIFDPVESARWIVQILNFVSNDFDNEDMCIYFLNEIPCNFNPSIYIYGTTILHVCEKRNFSDSTLLRLVQRTEGRFMFTFLFSVGLLTKKLGET